MTLPGEGTHDRTIRGVCPACGTAFLFLGADGYVTCSLHRCPDPGAADLLLQGSRAAVAALAACGGLADAVDALDGLSVVEWVSLRERVVRNAAAARAALQGVQS